MYTASVSLSRLTDGDRTVVEGAYHSYSFPSVPTRGSAGREPGDKPDAEIGELLATARALKSLAAKLEKRAKGKMRHKEEIARHKAEIAAKKTRWATRAERSLATYPALHAALNPTERYWR